MRGAHHCSGPPVSEMTSTVSSGTLNSTTPYHTVPAAPITAGQRERERERTLLGSITLRAVCNNILDVAYRLHRRDKCPSSSPLLKNGRGRRAFNGRKGVRENILHPYSHCRDVCSSRRSQPKVCMGGKSSCRKAAASSLLVPNVRHLYGAQTVTLRHFGLFGRSVYLLTRCP